MYERRKAGLGSLFGGQKGAKRGILGLKKAAHGVKTLANHLIYRCFSKIGENGLKQSEGGCARFYAILSGLL